MAHLNPGAPDDHGQMASRKAAERLEQFLKNNPSLQVSNLSSQHLSANAEPDPILAIASSIPHCPITPESVDLLLAVRNINRNMFAALDPSAHIEIKPWNKKGIEGEPQGGGVTSILRGDILEKAAVNMSVVCGPSYPSLEKEYSGKPFTAAGVSLICHPKNPNAPIAHMNVRMLTVGSGAETVSWIGGGADLTPMVKFPEDTKMFHAAMEQSCIQNRLGNYPRFREWCDEYFFIPHRGETRGVGGIFFDYQPLLQQTEHTDLGLLLDVGQLFARTYAEILARRVEMAYDDALADKHLYWRGRYAEFNLAYDRGTRFGLMSGGNVEAIFASLPPVVKW